MSLALLFKTFSFPLCRSLRTSQGLLSERQGFLLRLESQSGRCGWGEVSPFDADELKTCTSLLNNLGSFPSRRTLEDGMKLWPGSLAFGIGAALAEIDCVVGWGSKQGWLNAPSSAILIPSDKDVLQVVEHLVDQLKDRRKPFTVKWKVAVDSDREEKSTCKKILECLPPNGRLRLDANGGWDRTQAESWAKFVLSDARVEWLEQPLPVSDLEGLWKLSEKVPVALDESLLLDPSLRIIWPDWQVRRPTLEGDPKVLLAEFQQKVPRRVVCTAFETGIGRRWVNHLAALQQQGPTPTPPGLAPGWCPNGSLFSEDPEMVWHAA